MPSFISRLCGKEQNLYIRETKYVFDGWEPKHPSVTQAFGVTFQKFFGLLVTGWGSLDLI